jgi:hypothetical protein
VALEEAGGRMVCLALKVNVDKHAILILTGGVGGGDTWKSRPFEISDPDSDRR